MLKLYEARQFDQSPKNWGLYRNWLEIEESKQPSTEIKRPTP
jgi:hypothetical protein